MLTVSCLFGITFLALFVSTKAAVDIVEVFLDGNSSTNEGTVGGNVAAQQANPISNNKFYMSFAGAAYCFQTAPKYQNKPLNCPWCKEVPLGYKYYTTIKNSVYNTLALVVVNPDNNTIIVSFRGTTNLPNAMEDLSFALVSVNGTSQIKVHAGYRAATLSLYTDVLIILQNLTTNYDYTKVIITGHSLGAAEASLTTYFLVSQSALSTNATLELYTYGQPRVGNKVWADYMNSLNIVISRVVNKGDLIPHTVPAWFGYYHHQNEFWIKNITSANYCNGTVYEDSTCSNSAGPGYSAFDHLIYFEIDVTKCGLSVDLIPYAFQLVIDIAPLVNFLRLLALQLWAAALSFFSP